MFIYLHVFIFTDLKRSGRDLWMIARRKMLCKTRATLEQFQNIVASYVFKVIPKRFVIYTCICVYIHVCICAYVYKFVYTHACICFKYVYVHVFICIHESFMYAYALIPIYICSCICFKFMYV